jgi:hypothetical protein
MPLLGQPVGHLQQCVAAGARREQTLEVEVREAAGVRQHVPRRERLAPGPLELGQPGGQRLVQRDPPRLDLVEHRRGDDRLRDRGEEADGVHADPPPVGLPERLEADDAHRVGDPRTTNGAVPSAACAAARSKAGSRARRRRRASGWLGMSNTIATLGGSYDRRPDGGTSPGVSAGAAPRAPREKWANRRAQVSPSEYDLVRDQRRPRPRSGRSARSGHALRIAHRRGDPPPPRRRVGRDGRRLGCRARHRPDPRLSHGPWRTPHRARGPRGPQPQSPGRQPGPRGGRGMGPRGARRGAAAGRATRTRRCGLHGDRRPLALVRPGRRRAQGPGGRPDRRGPREDPGRHDEALHATRATRTSSACGTG